MDKLLTLDAKFTCNCAINKGIYGFISIPKNTTICTKYTATTNDKLVNQAPGTLCSNIVLPSGGNGPCIFVHSLPWENYSKKITHKGQNILTDKSFTRCPTYQIPLRVSQKLIQNKVKGE